jgi:hypothetical protein
MTLKRQFVNLVLESCKSGSSTMQIHRIRSSSLFHPKNRKGRPLPPTSLVEAELPKPARHSISSEEYRGIVGLDDQDRIVLARDICQNGLASKPRLKSWHPNDIAINLGDDLYLIDRCPRNGKPGPGYQPSRFQALIHGKPPAVAHVPDFAGWYWHSLPLPPYVETPGYDPDCDTNNIVSSAVVGDSIWVSAMGGIGTYAFDTGSREWSKVGSWELPFRGDVHYVPELDCWLGFSSRREEQFLCASDLSSSAEADGAAPTLCRVWEGDIASYPKTTKTWVLLRSDLVRVDSAGRFCIAREFHVFDGDKHPYIFNFAVFTGVELERSDDTAVGGIQVVKHKSIRYNFGRDRFQLVC